MDTEEEKDKKEEEDKDSKSNPEIEKSNIEKAVSLEIEMR